MIGHLQRRKAPRVRGVAHLVHSVDSLRLAERLDDAERLGLAERMDVGSGQAGQGGQNAALPLPILLQVNTAGEESKSGFAPGELAEALGAVLRLTTLRVEGLMTMAPLTNDEAVLRATFRGLRELRDEARGRLPTFAGTELSMGMSNDFEIAVEEGSTIVRLGTVLLGELPE